MPSLQIDGCDFPVHALWAHLQRTDSCHRFALFVESAYLVDVFDSFHCKREGDSWPLHIGTHIDELGTFAIEAYLQNIRRLLGTEPGPYKWVAASVDDILAEQSGVSIIGTAVAFIPELPKLVPLK